jgi:hypothetical protein
VTHLNRIASNGRMIDELEKIWKEVVIAKLRYEFCLEEENLDPKPRFQLRTS